MTNNDDRYQASKKETKKEAARRKRDLKLIRADKKRKSKGSSGDVNGQGKSLLV